MDDTGEQSESALSNATKSIAKTLQDQLGNLKTQVGTKSQSCLPEDILRDQDVFLKLRYHIGFPSCTDSLAYDARKKLLAVGTKYGRIKVIGSDGVECLLAEDSVSDEDEIKEDPGTVFVGFLKNRNEILRVSKNGRVLLFGLDEQGPVLDSTNVFRGQRDKGKLLEIVDVAMVPGGPYMVLGCSDGNSLVIQVGKEISIKPYRIFADDLEASGSLVCIDSTIAADRPLILFVYSVSEAVVYDVRAERIICTTPMRNRSRSDRSPTCACWIGEKGNCFAIGYSDGTISIWGISANAVKTKVSGVEEVVHVLTLKPSQSEMCSPIKSVTFLQGNIGTPQGKDCLLVLGGQSKGDPDMLTIVSLEPEGKHERDVTMVPWFGEIVSHSIMLPKDDSKAESKVMILTEGGQLVVHDLSTWEPLPVSLKFQELPPFSCSAFMASISDSGLHSPCLKNLRYLSWKHIQDTKWPFNGGIPPSNYFISESEYLSGESQEEGTHPSGVLMFGHRDGRIRVWDATSAVPKHMTTVPQNLDIFSEEGRLMPVTCFDACPISGLLAVGHAGGQVRVYQFSSTAQSVRRVCLDGSKIPFDIQIDQNPGWQYILKYSHHSGRDITSICLASRKGLLAVGDKGGYVSLVDIGSPRKMIDHKISSAVSRIKIAMFEDESFSDVNHCVLCLGQDGMLDMIASNNGCQLLSKPLKPKNDSFPIDLVLLDGEGRILPPLSGEIELLWADNNAISRPRTVGMTKLSNFSKGRKLGDTLQGMNADELLDDEISDTEHTADSEFDDINTDADLWNAVPSAESYQRKQKYPNDSFYTGYLRRNARASCKMIFIASSDSLRLYMMDNILKGERSPARKVRLPSNVSFSGSFHSVSGSGILVASNSISCFSLPGLQQMGKSIENYLIASGGSACPWTVSLDGQLLVSSSTNELMRYSSLVRAPLPLGPEKLVSSLHSGSIESTNGSKNSRESEGKGNNNPAMQGITTILGTVRGAAAAAAAGAGMMIQERTPGQRDLPSVREIFQKEVRPLDEDIVSVSSDEVEAVSTKPSSATMRRELLGSKATGTPKSSDAKSAKRTVSSVKRHYAAQNKTNETRSILENTRNLLAERGKKLENLQEKSEAMQNEAEDFASMAEELEKAFANKKWYQI